MADKNYGNDLQLAELVKYISDEMKFPILGAGGGYAPIGTINFFDTTTAPLGWLACDGSTHNISDYPDLATFYASVHGASNFYGGNGTTTFAVPNLQGEFLRGAGTNGHANQGSGANVGVHQDATEHHGTASHSNNTLGGLYNSSKDSIQKNIDSTVIAATHNRWADMTTVDADGYGSAAVYTSRPTNTSFLICVKATLSDTEINAFNVYTPREHQVAWWEEEIDGVWKRKPVYEKRYDGLALTIRANAWDESFLNVAELNIDVLIDNNIFEIVDNSRSRIYYPQTIQYQPDDDYLHVKGNGMPSSVTEILLRYTKTTDDWQTS